MLKMLKMRTQKKVRSMIKKTCIFLEKYLNCHKQNFGGNRNIKGAANKDSRENE